MDLPSTYQEILLAARHSFAQYARWHCPGFDCANSAAETLARWGKAPVTKAKSVPKAKAKDTLAAIRTDLDGCRRCPLSDNRHRIVTGEGDPKSEILFVGHAPGADEDQTGHPFTGPAGQLLDRIVEAMKLRRDQVYMCDVVKCRPLDDRTPAPQEIDSCRLFLDRQIAVIQPKVICALGTVAAQSLLNTTRPLIEMRGRFHDRSGIKVMPTFHPADLLKDPGLKRAVWEDVKKVMALLRIPL